MEQNSAAAWSNGPAAMWTMGDAARVCSMLEHVCDGDGEVMEAASQQSSRQGWASERNYSWFDMAVLQQ
jgi:hypothetical protein